MAVDAFLKLNGIPGESKKDGHKDEIDVLSWSWGLSQTGTMGTGGGGGAGKVNVHDLSFTKQVDISSNLLHLACCNGKHIKDAILVMRKAGEKPLEYLKIKLYDILVTSVQTSGSSQDLPLESCSLNFAKFEYAYQKQSASGAADGPAKTATWDVALGKS